MLDNFPHRKLIFSLYICIYMPVLSSRHVLAPEISIHIIRNNDVQNDSVVHLEKPRYNTLHWKVYNLA